MVAIINTDPIIIGKSSVLRASTISFPNPFHPKIYSTNTAPASILANHPDIAVMTGLSAFFKHGFDNLVEDKPFALAVRM